MYLGLDIGTSAVKAVLCNDEQSVVAQAESSLAISRPVAHWSEQNPEDWWQATLSVLGQLKTKNSQALLSVKSIGLAGQMHGAVLLDEKGKVLRPAILWNDGRSNTECVEIESSLKNFREIAGNIAMPGFTAPKLLWIKKHESNIFEKISMVLLPKDYIRFRLTDDYVSEMSDAAGTLWLDVAKRDWSDDLLATCSLTRKQMPLLVEGTDISSIVKSDVAETCGLSLGTLVAGGAGDNAAGAVGIGAVKSGSAFLSLGTSGVLFLPNDKFSPNTESAVHTFCHCLPDTWHQMTVMLSAASCLNWLSKLCGAKDETELLLEAETDLESSVANKLTFLPYLSGERTPYNNPSATGVFFGMTHNTTRASMTRAVLEGVAFAFADCMEALLATGAKINHISVIGGGAQSDFWGGILASVLKHDLNYHEEGELGPAFGAARLARLATGNGSLDEICTPPKITKVINPQSVEVNLYEEKQKRFRRLYQELKQEFTT